ncbi:MAG: FHA domain-containing protein [Myxococcales bacterium]
MAKKSGDDLPVKRATRMMRAAEAPPRRPRPVAKAPPRRDLAPTLQGEGPFASLSFALNRARLVVGRVGPANLLIDDDSVSRRHAEIVKTGQRFSVRDLNSSNGTFLNDERITEAELQPGDVVRFGVVELVFAGPGGEKPAKSEATTNRGSTKMIVLGIAGVAALAIAVVAIVRTGPPPEPPIRPPTGDKEREVAKKLGRCQSYSDRDSAEYDLNKCIATCTEVHELDETRGANRLAKRCQKELENEAFLEAANKLIGTGLEEEGLKELLKVEQGTAAFSKASARFNEAVDILLKKYRNQCKGDVNGGWFEAAYKQSCRRALELTCNRPEGADADALKYFQHAARNLGKGKGEYACPPEYAKFQSPIQTRTPDPVEEAQKAIRARYPNPKVGDAMVGYFKDGSAKKASSALKNLRSQATPNERSQLSDLILWLDLIDGKVTTGAGRIALKQAKEAEAVLKEAFDAEARVLPQGLESEAMRNVKADLAKLHAELAKDAYAKDHLEVCFEHAHRGSELNPKDTSLLDMLRRMERAASNRIGESPSCESVSFALKITGPEAPANEKALELGKALGCRLPKK